MHRGNHAEPDAGVSAADGDKSIKSATFFTTLPDFSDPGEVGVFLDNDFVDGIERQVAVDGVLDKFFMSRTFSFLRSNDLIYQPAIKSYMMGEAPPAFDLLYWNGDGTNLPAKMSIEYLRGLCQRDELSKGEFPVFVSRIRADKSVANGLSLWVVGDNLRKGAALNAGQIVESLLR